MAIKQLGYVVIETAKADVWRDYMTQVVGAMSADESADGAAHYRVDDRVFRFRIVDSDVERLAAAAYEVDSRGSLDELAGKIEAAERDVAWGDDAGASIRGVEAYFSTSDPAGNGLEFYVGDAKSDQPFVSPQDVSGFVTGEFGMGHAVFAAPDFEKSHAFYRDTIGFHDTDLPHFRFSPDPEDPGMRFAFMHADNGRHHALAIGEMPQNPASCVHLMLEMKNVSDVGKCHDRMRGAGVEESASIGRHQNDQTLGFYMKTPSGFDLEIGCDSLVIDPGSWKATAHGQPSEWGHVWSWQKAMEESESTQ
ncbi:VOC family protein [Erythrobacter alti]|uniref:VOC family protein n=1 Tax=Erythrobacter alti TaxID=1896145 RepID=UPI0030F3D81A